MAFSTCLIGFLPTYQSVDVMSLIAEKSELIMQNYLFLATMVLGLGLRHGFDLDHLATIDAITNTVRRQTPLAKLVGVLFSLGHGLIVTAISIIIGARLLHVEFSHKLATFGAVTSILFLFIFGLFNLFSRQLSSLRSLLVRKIITRKNSPLWIIITGALFAISFDTFSQVALFSISASMISGWLFSGILGIVFMLGMMASDGLNGWLVSIAIQHAENFSTLLSRYFGLAIAVFSLITGAFGLIKLCLL